MQRMDRRPWRADYHEGDLAFTADCESFECPVSVITPRIKRLVSMAMESRQVHGACGATFGGPDSSKWPAWWFDTVATVERARIEEHNARIEEQNRKVKS